MKKNTWRYQLLDRGNIIVLVEVYSNTLYSDPVMTFEKKDVASIINDVREENDCKIRDIAKYGLLAEEEFRNKLGKSSFDLSKEEVEDMEE